MKLKLAAKATQETIMPTSSYGVAQLQGRLYFTQLMNS